MKLKKNVILVYAAAGSLLFKGSIVTFLVNLVMQGDDFSEIAGIALLCGIVCLHGFLTAKGSVHALEAIQVYEAPDSVNTWILWLVSHTAGFITIICGFFVGLVYLFDEDMSKISTAILLVGFLVLVICCIFYPMLVGYNPEESDAEAADGNQEQDTVLPPDEEDPLSEAEQNLRVLMTEGLLTQEEYDALTSRKS